MNSTLRYLMLFCIWLTSGNLFAKTKDCKSLTGAVNIYKHFTGTIGKRKVSLDLRYGYCGASNYGGSYIYDAGGKAVRKLIIGEPATFDYKTPLSATESGVTDDWMSREDSKGAPFPTWEFTITSEHLSGKWYSGDKKTVLAINMTEDYKHSVPLVVMEYRDSAKKAVPLTSIVADYRFVCAMPDAQVPKAEADFINSQLLQLAGSSVKAGTMHELPTTEAHSDFDEFDKNCDKIAADTVALTKNLLRNNSYHSLLFPVYNDNGLLVMEYNQFAFTMNGISSSRRYMCMDVARKKVYRLNDIVANNAGLTKLLQDEYASRLKHDTGMAKAAGTIAPTENVIVTNNALIFCYASADKMHVTDDVRLFMPYEQLKNLLTADFKERLHV